MMHREAFCLYVSNRLIKTVLCLLCDLCIYYFVNQLYVYDAADKSAECVVDQIADLKCASAGDELHYLNAQRKYKR